MKIRMDFVTNSSSSSYCTVRIDTDDGVVDVGQMDYVGFYTFWFHDPTSRLGEVKDADDLVAAIEHAVGADSYTLNEDYLRGRIDDIKDFSSLRSISINCHESVSDRGYGYPWPRDVYYDYNFGTGEKRVHSDTDWWSYRGHGDPVKPDFRSPDGEELPFDFLERGNLYTAVAYHGGDEEVFVPERVLEDGRELVVRAIGPKCFSGNRSIRMVVIPRTVERIAPDAFEGTRRRVLSMRFADGEEGETTFSRNGSKLVLTVSPEKELAIPEDIDELGESAFGGCLSLRTIRLHDGMKKPTVKSLQSCDSLAWVILTDGSKVSVARREAMRCFTVSRGVIRFNYAKCAGLMLEAGDALEFKRAVRGGALTAEDLEGFYEKIKLKRKPEYKEMKEFILQRIDAKGGSRGRGSRKSASRSKPAGD